MSARGCHECGGIYTHQGMCSMLPAESEAGRERDRKRTMAIEKCDDCGGDPHNGSCESEHERLRAARIAANRGPVFPTASGVVIEVVEPGTVIRNDRGVELTVEEGVGVRRGGTFFVTQQVWDALLALVPTVRVMT